MFGLGPLEILGILLLALLVFGKRLPEIGRGVGKSIVEFKKGLAGIEDELHPDKPNQYQQPSTPPQNQQSQPPAQPNRLENQQTNTTSTANTSSNMDQRTAQPAPQSGTYHTTPSQPNEPPQE